MLLRYAQGDNFDAGKRLTRWYEQQLLKMSFVAALNRSR